MYVAPAHPQFFSAIAPACQRESRSWAITMNFFESQAKARSNTFKLVFLFALAVISLILLTDLLVIWALGIGTKLNHPGLLQVDISYMEIMVVSLAVLAVVLFGSLYKTMSLSSGGRAVAELLDAQLISQDAADLKLRKVLNVVEEMAIASGTSVPPVYLLAGEPGINAFAAGFTPKDAIIGITRGAVDRLSREQLQGVIAHEFSHIFNGDMRLNIRLLGVLSGIELIGMAGYHLLRGLNQSSGSSRSSKRDGGQLFLLAIGLMVIGFAGAFFAGLIRAAVSRQREFLADASAVQYTRNPDGIAGALKIIGGLEYGSLVENPRAAEVSHAFFAQGVSGYMQAFSATHPPLKERILKIDPNWDGVYPNVEIEPQEAAVRVADNARHGADIAQKAMTGALGTVMPNAVKTLEPIGRAQAETVDYARSLIAALPPAVEEAAREPYGATALIYALLLDGRPEIRFSQLAHINKHAIPGVYNLLQKLMPDSDGMDIKFRLPIINLAMPSLKRLSRDQYQTFREDLVALIEMDGKVNMLEWALQKIVLSNLDAHYFEPVKNGMHQFDIAQLSKEVELVLSVLAYAGHEDMKMTEAAFSAACLELGMNTLSLQPKSEIRLAVLDESMRMLEKLKPLVKPRFIKACAACILNDQQVTITEIELLRAFSDMLGSPMPPVFNVESS